MQQWRAISQIVTCDKKWILYNHQQWPAQSLDREEAPKHFQSQTCIKTRSWSLFGGLLPAWSTTVLRIPAKPIHLKSMHAQQINEMQWKLQCLQPALINRKDPTLLHDKAWQPTTQSMLQKLNKLGYKVLLHYTYLPDLLLTDCHFKYRQFFAGKMLPQPAGGRKCFSKVHQILKHRFLHYRNKQTYFSLAKMCWL